MRRILFSTVLAVLSVVVLATTASSQEAPSGGDQLETDQWFVGELNGHPAVSLHEVCTRHADGTRTTSTDMALVIKRNLDDPAKKKPEKKAPAEADTRLEVRDSQVFEEGAAGNITSFRFDHEESGTRSSASGRVEKSGDASGDARHVIATLHRLGRKTDFDLPLSAGTELVGDRRSQELLCRADLKAGEAQSFVSVGLVNDRVMIVTSTATYSGVDAVGGRAFDLVTDVMPIPMRMLLSPKGDLLGMTMNLAIFKLELKPSDGPVSLLGADMAATGLVTATGPAPKPAAVNRYRLPEGGIAAEDEFQHLDEGVLTVVSEAVPSALAEREEYLKAEPHLEIDDPAMRQWVDDVTSAPQARAGSPADAVTQADVAEDLRLAVRAYLKRDLSVGDGSALATFRSRHGDCTEHAALLCAALRIAGIPARIEVGMVFSADHGGWVGHAWNSAYVDGHWAHLDSAYPGMARSCYIKLASTTGKDDESTPAVMLKNLASVMGKDIETLP